MTLTDLAHDRVRARDPEPPADATVTADVAASTGQVTVKLGQGRDAYTLLADWASNGRLPAAGDRAAVIQTPLGAWAIVSATGDLITA